MDVLLINPYNENAVKNSLGFITPPLNLMYLGGALEDASFSVSIIDDDLEKLGQEKISKITYKLNPKIVGFTATTSTIKNALEYSNLIKKALPDSLIVLGGLHPTFMPVDTLKNSESLDAIVIGERTMVELAENYCADVGTLDIVLNLILASNF